MIPEYIGYISFLLGFCLGAIIAMMFSSEGGKNG